MQRDRLKTIVNKLIDKKLELNYDNSEIYNPMLMDFCNMYGEQCLYGELRGWVGFTLPNTHYVFNEYGEKIMGIFYKKQPSPTLAFVVDGYPTIQSSTRLNVDVFDKIIETCVDFFKI